LIPQPVIQYNIFRTFVLSIAPAKGEDIMREEYLKEITPLLEKCDISTLDLIYQILFKKCQNA
jgi:hypothetical protein